MKTNLSIFLSALALLFVACTKDDISDGITIDDLSGKIVFQKISNRTLKMADVNSMHNATSFGYAMTYTRPVWAYDGSKFAAIDLISSVETESGVSVFAIKIVDVESESTTTWEIAPSTILDLNGPLSWSPDGNTIAFLTHPDNRIIYLNTQNGDTIQTEFSGKISGGITALDWHPEGDIAVSISFWHDYQHDIEIWMLEPFTTTLKSKISASAITRPLAFEFMDWNTAGSKLLLSASAYYRDIEVLDLNTGECTSIPDINGVAPSWSPDGKYILYTEGAGASDLKIIPGLYVSDIEGSFEKLLISDAGYSDWH